MSKGSLHPGSPFSYACTRCSRCCVDKLIQVNPYEMARLAAHFGLSTGEFRGRFTDGARLRQDERGRCVFLGESGCSVHADRPLVCRLFPLGRIVDEEGTSTYCRPDYDPGPAGAFGSDSSVSDYVATQGASPFIAAADAYFRWYCRARRADAAADSGTEPAVDLLDIDDQVGRWCREHAVEEPRELGARYQLHLEILDAFIEEGGSHVTD